MAKVVRISQAIFKKRDGNELSFEELEFFVQGSLNGAVSKEQIVTGAMLMAMFLRGLSSKETTILTKLMLDSGTNLRWPEEFRGKVVDKHSTGGVGDKISLLLIPALAACGLKVPKMSGRGLGYTGGTLDKLESIPGFKVSRSVKEIHEQVYKVGCAIVGQTGDLVPADKYFYSVRDVTATIENPQLIAASIMSKKMAESLDALVIELTYGCASAVLNEPEAHKLGDILISLGNSVGINMSVVFTSMETPLGFNIGNALEVIEIIKCFQHEVPPDIMELYLKLGSCLVQDAELVEGDTAAETLLRNVLEDGSACFKFQEMIIEQGVDRHFVSKLFDKDADLQTLLPTSKYKTELSSPAAGVVTRLNARTLGDTCMRLGAGRSKPQDGINYAVGMELLCSIGTVLERGQSWVRIHHDDELSQQLVDDINSAISLSPGAPQGTPRHRVTGVVHGQVRK